MVTKVAKNKLTQEEKNQKYWEDRVANRVWKIYNATEERNRELLEFYLDASRAIKEELYDLAEKYSKDGVLSLSEMHKQNRLTELNQKYEDIAKNLGEKIEKTATDNMHESFKETYKEVATGMGDIDFAMPNKKLMDKLLDEPWRGDNFSGRLWKNTKKLAVGLNSILLTGLQQGKTVTEIAVGLHNFTGQSFNNCHRLIRTETMHYLNSATIQRYRDAGMKYVQVIAAQDERTCDTCGTYHGKIYPIDKCPVLPFHANCRCTIVPYFDEKINGALKNIEKDNEDGTINSREIFENKAYAAAIKLEEQKIYQENTETAIILDKKGNVIFRESSGASNYVKFSKEQLDRMKGATLTHNHPSNSTFSIEDLALMVIRELEIIRATGTMRTYQLKRIKSAPIKTEFPVEYEKAMKDNKKITDKEFHEYEKRRKQKQISPLEYQERIKGLNKKWNDLNSEWLKKNAKDYGYRYSVIERRR
ncbi:MAG TPA: hypothetical protein DEB74_12525 [Lachnospiraceae bacterium]|nr:hypothetical protein [Lachnospiraceae bacterium]